jgi:superfamily II DNA or RNA helicase
MERPLTGTAAEVRAAIARAVLDDGVAPELGLVRLRPHQRTAAARIRRMLEEHGGALLADAVGLGKTFVALAVARSARMPLVVAPAALLPMWRSAAAEASTPVELVSYEALSRGAAPPIVPDLLVLDEAHHARTPGTRRYGRLASLATNARVLLVSATPVHNRRDDLAALLALFLGARAWRLSVAELAAFVVRRDRERVAAAELPAVDPTRTIEVGDDAELLRAIVELPPPIPPSDGGDGGALLTLSLVRLWASSEAALFAALTERLARADAMAYALEQGRHPSRAELSAWAFADGALQLAFPELVTAGTDARAAELLRALRAHAVALRALRERAARSNAMDGVRAQRLREIRAAHPGERVVAFAQYTETVRALFGMLRADGAVGLVTSRGGVVAGGPIARREMLERFAPAASGRNPPSAAERVELLLTTDLLSEGVNLQDASVVVHLDLPWTPARMEQRVGRSRRLGARHRRTSVYAFRPPAASEELARVEERLRAKVREAARAIGAAGAILPGISTPESVEAHVLSAREALLDRLERWRDDTLEVPEPGDVLTAAVRARVRAALAAVHVGRTCSLVAITGDGSVTDDPRVLAALAGEGDGDEMPCDHAAVAHAIVLIGRWQERRRAAAASGATLSIAGSPRRAAIQRIARITARLPHHRRPALLPLAVRARQAVTAHFGVGGERVLAELAEAPLPDDAWLRAITAFGDAHALAATTGPRPDADGRVLAVLLLVPERG